MAQSISKISKPIALSVWSDIYPLFGQGSIGEFIKTPYCSLYLLTVLIIHDIGNRELT
ncbi:hypothetical protein [Phormidesmis priestleyi]